MFNPISIIKFLSLGLSYLHLEFRYQVRKIKIKQILFKEELSKALENAM